MGKMWKTEKVGCHWTLSEAEELSDMEKQAAMQPSWLGSLCEIIIWFLGG